MYRGLFNLRRGLDKDDYAVVGTMTAVLMLRWNEWVHRKVETVTFVDEDAARRSVGIDFTLPFWIHQARGTPQNATKRQLVPLALLRKGTLANFDLRDEANSSLPLLTTAQNRQVAEASLVALANATLQLDVVADAPSIQCDIRHLVEAPARKEGNRALAELFAKRDRHEALRQRLRDDHTFRRVAGPLATHFVALTMVDIARHQRRVFHYGYEESLFDNPLRQRSVGIALGEPRVLWMMIPRVGDAESYHFEVEAPDGMQVNTHQGVLSTEPSATSQSFRRTSKQGTFQRSHVHFSEAEAGDQAMVLVELRPRESTIVRGAFLAGLMSLALIALVGLRLSEIIAHQGGEAAATLLLAIPGVAVALLSRIDDNEMSTTLLWPVRQLSMVPGLGSFIAAGAVVGGNDDCATRAVLAAAALIALIGTAALARTWLAARSDDERDHPTNGE